MLTGRLLVIPGFGTRARTTCVSNNDEFCIENEEFCIKNEELCIKNDEFCIEN